MIFSSLPVSNEIENLNILFFFLDTNAVSLIPVSCLVLLLYSKDASSSLFFQSR